MMRTSLGVIAGLVVMFITVASVQVIGHAVYPPPPGIDPTNHEAMVALIPTMPLMALGFVLIAWAFGTFLGAYTAATISLRHRLPAAIVIALVVEAAVIAIFSQIPHPAWMVVSGLLIPLPFAFLAWRLARRPMA